MFLRPQHDNEAAKLRLTELAKREDSLRSSIGISPSPENARARLDLAGLLCWKGLYRQAIDLLEPLLSDPFSVEVKVEARQILADNNFRHDQYDLANLTYLENHTIATEAGLEYWAARARAGRAWVLIDVGHYRSGEFEEAENIFLKNLPLHRSSASPIAEAMCIYGLSRAAAGKGNYDEAIALAQQSIDILNANGGEDLLQLPILQIANVYRDHGNYDQAIPYYEKAAEAVDRSQDTYVQVLVAYNYGILHKWKGEHHLAEQLWKLVLPMASELDYPRLGSEICRHMSEVAAARSDYKEAYSHQMESLAFGNRVGVISPVLQNQRMLLRTAMDRTWQLEQRLSFLTAGVEASEDGIFVLGEPTSGVHHDDFLIQFVNAAAANMLGKMPDEMHNILLKTIWKSPTAERIVGPSLEVFRTGVRCTLDTVELEFLEGEPRWYSVKIAKITGGIAWTVSDVTERENMRREILAQRDKLEEQNLRLTVLDREKTEVLGIAAHDLRSPLCNIRSLCDFISAADSESAHMTALISSTSDSLLALLSNLLDLDRIERGKFELRCVRTPIVPIVRSIVDQFVASAKEKQIQIDVEISGESLDAIADEGSVQRVVQNLLSNAVKFSPMGLRVKVRAHAVGERVRIEIQDHGPGLSESDHTALYRKFSRLSARPTAGESSSGLGLSIARHLADAMKGAIGCHSVPGEGATFWLELPLA